MHRRIPFLASTILLLAGCRDLGLAGRLFACANDGECGAGTLCHPVAKVCVAPDADVSWLIDADAGVADLPEDEAQAIADEGSGDPGGPDSERHDLVEVVWDVPDFPDALDVANFTELLPTDETGIEPDDVPSSHDLADPGEPKPDDGVLDPGMDAGADAQADGVAGSDIGAADMAEADPGVSETLADVGPDVSPPTRLCWPCMTDEDCRGPGGLSNDSCYRYGPQGSFCARDCTETGTCPDGYACIVDRPGAHVCRPESGKCVCDAAAIEAGASTVCSITNAFGTCQGISACSSSGMTPCSAATPEPETCDGKDSDCDGVTDPEGSLGCALWWRDADKDGWGTEALCLCGPEGEFTAAVGGDCAASNPSIHPGGVEACNGLDDDCDGDTDGEGSSGCTVRYRNEDADGYGVSGDHRCLCGPEAPYTAGSGGDCDDARAAVHPGATETCNGRDDDCDGQTDPAGASGCQPYFPDSDRDGFGGNEAGTCLCGPVGILSAIVAGDCDDADSAIHPGTAESCNGRDDDCDGLTDEEGATGCLVFFQDADADGFGTGSGRCLCAPSGSFVATKAGDCDDGNAEIRPGVVETCNGLDDDCNNQTDEEGAVGCKPWYLDEDLDGYGVTASTRCLCGATGSYRAIRGGDCDDKLAIIHPDAPEVCGNDADENCDGQTDDPGCSGCQEWYRDGDGDGFGVTDDTQCLAKPNGFYRAVKGGDCADGDAAIHPGAVETCNGLDDDCDGQTDGEGASGCTLWYFDGDGDGYGTSPSRCLCAASGKFTATKTDDCDDSRAGTHPGAIEICNGLDDDCDAETDEEGSAGCTRFYRDSDRDGHGSEAFRCLCLASGDFTAPASGDCDDENAGVHPGATEVCNDLDDDCDGATDEGVLAPCGGCATVCVLGAGPDTSFPFDADAAGATGFARDASGNLFLDPVRNAPTVLWVANSGDASVTRLDTRIGPKTGCEVGRYGGFNDPSGIAVDFSGAGFVASRGDGRVAKIAAAGSDCVDRNANGKIDTSRDADGDCAISAGERVSADECILWTVQPDGPSPAVCNVADHGCSRSVAVDREGNAWVAFWNSKTLYRLDGRDGATLAKMTLTCRPYALAIGPDGALWVTCREPTPHRLLRVAPEGGVTGTWETPTGQAYGIAVDPWGKVWVASNDKAGLQRFDPSDQTWKTWDWAGKGDTRGVAIRVVKDVAGTVLDASVTVTHAAGWPNQPSAVSTVSVVGAKSLLPGTAITVGPERMPIGIAVDPDGSLWTANWYGADHGTATRLDPATGAVLGTFAVGQSPYTIGDMTGYAFRSVVAPAGRYRQTFDGWPTGNTKWISVMVTAAGEPGKWRVRLRWRVADSAQNLAGKAWTAVPDSFPPATWPALLGNATGRLLEVEVTLQSDDPLLVPMLQGIVVAAMKTS